MIPKDLKNLSNLKMSYFVGDLFKKMEVLDGNSISDFAISQPKLLKKMFQDTDETNSASQFESLLDQILREDPIDSDRRKFLRD
jgi:hypothetical protein